MVHQVYSNNDKDHQSQVFKDVAQKSSLSISKTKRILEYYNDYWTSIVNFGYSLNIVDLFYLSLQPKASSLNDKLLIVPEQEYSVNNPYIPDSLTYSLKVDKSKILQVIVNYNQRFKQSIISDYSNISNYLTMFYVSDKQNPRIIISHNMKQHKPNELTFILTDGKKEALTTFKKDDLVYKNIWIR